MNEEWTAATGNRPIAFKSDVTQEIERGVRLDDFFPESREWRSQCILVGDCG